MRKSIVLGAIVTLSLLVCSCGFEAYTAYVTVGCNGEFYVYNMVQSGGGCTPTLEIISSEGATISRARITSRYDEKNHPGVFDTYIGGTLNDPCSDAVVQYRIICGKDTVIKTVVVKSRGFQATGPATTTFNPQTGQFEYDIEFRCCPNGPASQFTVTHAEYGWFENVTAVPEKIDCPGAGGVQIIRVSGTLKRPVASSVWVTIKGPAGHCDIETRVQ